MSSALNYAKKAAFMHVNVQSRGLTLDFEIRCPQWILLVYCFSYILKDRVRCSDINDEHGYSY